MANRFYSPDQQFISNSGVPYAGGFLYFYATGTSTPQNTYSDAALTIANTNPIVLDSNGQAGSVFLQNLAYKVVLADINNQQIWTEDPVYTSDYSTYAQFQPYNGNPNGFVAGTAGTVGTMPGTSAVWDYVDDILYICTTTGNAATAVWTAINASAATPATPFPQGYLTLNSDANNPIITADFTANTAVYYSPYVGNLVPVYNGSAFITTSFSQLTLTLTTSQAASTIYDVFVFSNSGVLTLVTGPAWSSSTAGSGSRGTGAGTTQLQRVNGLWVNGVQITGRNNANTYTIPANTATYLGSIFVDTTAGQISCYRSYGQSRKFGVWNAYNRVPIQMVAGDASIQWAYETNGFRAANGNSANSITLFQGLAEEQCDCTYSVILSVALASPQTAAGQNAIGFNSTSSVSGTLGVYTVSAASSTTVAFAATLRAEYIAPPSLGINVVTALENGLGSTAGTFGWGGSSQSGNQLAIRYRG